MRSFGVEEEFQLVDAGTLRPAPLGEAIVAEHQRHAVTDISGAGVARGLMHRWTRRSRHELETEMHQEQLEVAGPPVTTFDAQLTAIRAGRALADNTARELGARVVALASPVWPEVPHLTTSHRTQTIGADFGLLSAEQLTCGMHVHVEVASRHEGIQVLNRIRPWLHVLLALSANSPFWYGEDSEFHSYRYPSWSRWPTAGPTDVFGSPLAYDSRIRSLLRAGAALDVGMVYFDARLSEHCPTVEVRVADVCPEARHAAVIASVTRALVETAAAEWVSGEPPRQFSTAQLRAWAWHAARHGAETTLASPRTGVQVPAAEVVGELLEHIMPALHDSGEVDDVVEVLTDMLAGRTGAAVQRQAYSWRHDLRDVVAAALELTHGVHPPTTPTQFDRTLSA